MAKGRIHPRLSFFLRKEVAEAKIDGEKINLYVSVTDSTPIVVSKTTGKVFTLSWEDIVGIALEAGILKED